MIQCNTVFIQTEDTPNPNTLKFLPGLTVLKEGTLEFINEKGAQGSELALLLFRTKNVVRVLFGCDFISVTKSDDAHWHILKPDILTSIMEYFTINDEHTPFIEKEEKVSIDFDAKDNDVVQQIQELILNRVRPAVMQDGGDIEFRKYKDGIVYLQLKGACSGCPSAALTLKDGIEEMLKYYIPEIQSVEAIEE